MTDGHLATRVAGAMYALLGTGFGAGALWATIHLRRTGELPMTPFGFRALSGPFERFGTDWFSAFGVSLAAMCALNLIGGVWLWRGRRRGLRLTLATFVPTMALGVGFALPFLLIGIPVAAVIALAGRASLRSRDI